MRFESEQDIYSPKPRYIKNVKVGDVIKTFKDGVEFSNVREILNYVVVAVYPFHVRAKCNRMGNGGFLITETRCFNLGQLVRLGLEPSGGERFGMLNPIEANDYQED